MANPMERATALATMLDDLRPQRQDELPMTDREKPSHGRSYQGGNIFNMRPRHTGPTQSAGAGWNDLVKNGINDAESESVKGLDDLGGGRVYAASRDIAQKMLRDVGARHAKAFRAAGGFAVSKLGVVCRENVPVVRFDNSRQKAASTSGSNIGKVQEPKAQPTPLRCPAVNVRVSPGRQVSASVDLQRGWDAVLAQADQRQRPKPAPAAAPSSPSVPTGAESALDASTPITQRTPTIGAVSGQPARDLTSSQPPAPSQGPLQAGGSGSGLNPVRQSTHDHKRQGSGWGKPFEVESPVADQVNKMDRKAQDKASDPPADTQASSTVAPSTTKQALIVSWPQSCLVTIGNGTQTCPSSGTLVVRLYEQGDEFIIGFKFNLQNGTRISFAWQGLAAVDFDIRDAAGNRLPTCKLTFSVREPSGNKGFCPYTLQFATMDLVDELKERIKTLRDIKLHNKDVAHGKTAIQEYLERSKNKDQSGEDQVDLAPFLDDAVKHIAIRNQIDPAAVTERLATIFGLVFMRSIDERIEDEKDQERDEEAATKANKEIKAIDSLAQPVSALNDQVPVTLSGGAEMSIEKTASVQVTAVSKPSSSAQVNAEDKPMAYVSVPPTATMTKPVVELDNIPAVKGEHSAAAASKTDEGELINMKTTVQVGRGSESLPSLDANGEALPQKKTVSITSEEVRRTGRLIRKTVTVEEFEYEDTEH